MTVGGRQACSCVRHTMYECSPIYLYKIIYHNCVVLNYNFACITYRERDMCGLGTMTADDTRAWSVLQYRSVTKMQFDLDTEQFHNLFEFP